VDAGRGDQSGPGEEVLAELPADYRPHRPYHPEGAISRCVVRSVPVPIFARERGLTDRSPQVSTAGRAYGGRLHSEVSSVSTSLRSVRAVLSKPQVSISFTHGQVPLATFKTVVSDNCAVKCRRARQGARW
jgi:hypothetical protein